MIKTAIASLVTAAVLTGVGAGIASASTPAPHMPARAAAPVDAPVTPVNPAGGTATILGLAGVGGAYGAVIGATVGGVAAGASVCVITLPACLVTLPPAVLAGATGGALVGGAIGAAVGGGGATAALLRPMP